MKSKRLGLIGLGDMGLAMARCLLAADYPVTGFDVRAERGALLEQAGGTAAASPAEVGRASDVAIVMVFNGQQVLQSLQGEAGLGAGMAPGGTVIITSTIEPREVRAAAALLAEKRVAYHRLLGQWRPYHGADRRALADGGRGDGRP